ncbi:hypothetical protein H5410_001539 [Solanum commersonii]|uniref:Uncharacterized protein n=1 Tax=Solanum commersonii TaxID=4109 RepID=A0A9J6AZ91_SOLCO|nr:hypothetical protein H5410_001539 [Solanum commersonii]
MKRAIGVEVNKQVRNKILKKRIHMTIKHVQQSRCTEEVEERIKKNDVVNDFIYEAYMRLTEIMEQQERRFTRNQERTDGIKYTLNQNNEQKSLAGNKSQVAENRLEPTSEQSRSFDHKKGSDTNSDKRNPRKISNFEQNPREPVARLYDGEGHEEDGHARSHQIDLMGCRVASGFDLNLGGLSRWAVAVSFWAAVRFYEEEEERCRWGLLMGLTDLEELGSWKLQDKSPKIGLINEVKVMASKL